MSSPSFAPPHVNYTSYVPAALPSAHDVAAVLIDKQHENGRNIDKMQLEKLLYLVLGAHFAMWNVRAFREVPLAYQRGPVIRNVEDVYRDGPQTIPAPIGGDPTKVGPELLATIDLVLFHFGAWSAVRLERFTKLKGAPWSETRGDLPASAPSDREIAEPLIAGWFRKHGVNPSPPRISAKDRQLVLAASTGDEEALRKLVG